MDPSPPRLLWLTENYPPDRGGMACSCDRLVRNLRRAGATVDVACFSRRGGATPDLTVETRAGGAELRAAAGAGADPGHAVNRMWGAVRARRRAAGAYTHVVAFGGVLPLLAAPPFARWLGAPLCTLLRGNDFDTGLFSPGRAPLVREALAGADGIGGVTTDEVERIRALYPGKRVAWTPNGIDAANFRLLPEDRARGEAWRRQHVAPGRRVLGLYGQLKPKKGTTFFLEALAASGAAERLHLLLVGDVEDEVLAWLGAAGPAVAHTVLPFRDRFELLPLYAAADLAVLPSFYDGMPNVLLEAAALGVPLLASDAGGMADVLVADDSAIMFAAGDAHACSRAVARAAELPAAALAGLAARARADVLARFDERNETERHLRLLAETAGGRDGRGEQT